MQYTTLKQNPSLSRSLSLSHTNTHTHTHTQQNTHTHTQLDIKNMKCSTSLLQICISVLTVQSYLQAAQSQLSSALEHLWPINESLNMSVSLDRSLCLSLSLIHTH